MCGNSSDYSGWNIDDKSSSQEWKSGEMLGPRTGSPVDDKFVINDDMNFDTVTESNLAIRSRSFLHRRFRKIFDHSSKDAMQDIDNRSMIWRMFQSSTSEASVMHWKKSLRHFAFHQKNRQRFYCETIDFSTYLKR